MAPPYKYIKLRYDHITKPDNDKRLYRGLILSNYLKVLLISDPSAKKGAAALVVDVGYMSDPNDLPGLAHLCQHMLLRGSMKYPKEDEYYAYISQHGGTTCAEVKLDHTYYYFDVGLGKLHDALDRFAQAFVAPLFPQSMIKWAVNIIDSEFTRKYLVDDGSRFSHLRRQLMGQVFSKFGVGNKQTLYIKPKEKDINVRDRLVSFFEEHYSANIMSLCVFSNEDLDKLEDMVTRLFCEISSKIQTTSLTNKPCYESFMNEHSAFNTVCIVPKENINSLVLSFYLPDLQEKYPSKSMSYISYILAYGGKGSLTAILKARDWCNSFTSATDVICKGYNFFSMTFDLTEDKLKHIGDIIKLVFQYLHWLKEQITESRKIDEIFTDYKNITNMIFRYKEIPASISYMVSNAKALLLYPMSDVLSAERIISKWNKQEMPLMMNYLQPTNMRAYIITKKCASIAKTKEPWYGIMYKKVKMSQESITKWEKNQNEIFNFSPMNEYMASRFIFKNSNIEVKSTSPLLIQRTSLVTLWYARDNVHKIPEANMFFDFVKIFLYILRDSLTDIINTAQLAKLKVTLRESVIKFGITISISGNDHKQDVLLKAILDHIYINDLNNFKNHPLDTQAFYYLSAAVGEEIWLLNELLDEIECITVELFKQFVQKFLSKIHVEGFIYGRRFVIPIENQHQEDSCTLVYYQAGMQSTQSNMLLNLIVQIISRPCIYTLKTKEQLGHKILIQRHATKITHGLVILVIGDKKKPQYVEKRIDSFLHSMLELIDISTQRKLSVHIKSAHVKFNMPADKKSKNKKKEVQINIQHEELATQYEDFSSIITLFDDETSEAHINTQHEKPASSTEPSDDKSAHTSKELTNSKCEQPILTSREPSDKESIEKNKLISQKNITHEESVLSTKTLDDKPTKISEIYLEVLSISLLRFCSGNKIFEFKSSVANMESPFKYVKEQHDDINKSGLDERSYRGLILANDLKVLLISDPSATKHAAALNVNVGYMSDPDDLPGLAHLCQRMLFAGSTKYPGMYEYRTYISKHAGTSCAEVKLDHTYYYFDVGLGMLHDVLDHFAQAFIAPLFPQNMIEEEVNIIDLEFTKKYLVDDDSRISQLRRQFANSTHPFSKFGVGNKQTLDINPKKNGIDVRERVISFFQEHYSANIMSLCVLSNEDINTLEETVAKLFCEILNKKINAESWHKKSFNVEKNTFNKLYIVPRKNINTLVLSFPLDDLRHCSYEALPLSHISRNLQNGGEESLLLSLKEKSWCYSITGEVDFVARGFSFFSISFDLTEDAMKHIDDIIEITLMHIKKIKNSVSTEHYLKFNSRYNDFTNANFDHSKIPASLSFVISCAKALLVYPMINVLIAERVIIKSNTMCITSVFNYLEPRNMRIHLISKKYIDIADNNEFWYGTIYKEEKIPKEKFEKWLKLSNTSTFRISDTRLMFMASRFNIKETEIEIPWITGESRFITLWHVKDNVYKIPQANMFFELTSPLSRADPFIYSVNKIFLYLLRDSLTEHINAAEEINLKVELKENNNKVGVTLGISGCDDKQDVLLQIILERIANFTFDTTRFDIFKERYINYLKDFNNNSPDVQAVYYLSVLLRENAPLFDELLNISTYITVDKLEQSIPWLLSRMHVKGLIYGNITQEEAINIFKLIEFTLKKSILNIAPLTPKELMPVRDICLNKVTGIIVYSHVAGHQLLTITTMFHEDSCTLVYYQAGVQSTKANVLLKLIVQIISMPFIQFLKDIKQLGHKVITERYTTEATHGLMILVVGNKYETSYVEKKINSFIKYMSVSIVMNRIKISKRSRMIFRCVIFTLNKRNGLSLKSIIRNVS
ncbi:PREDICTED: uncharacterized protein LOC106741566 [Dinoponera quadriceps]|uniref:Uncharacterized protein LOC106741566 n=1 Tax=Dinoponera quadriceps TaxID=609295 RepID=A0A6P3WST4_DINQU|nr:PREDICTED: uncharacterized protein LOC106741566 [Dinoponera quadriceps]